MSRVAKRGRGRPKGSGRNTARIEIRLEPLAKVLFEDAAAKSGLSLSEWLVRAGGFCVWNHVQFDRPKCPVRTAIKPEVKK